MPSAKQGYPDFSSLADQRVAQHFKLVWDRLNAIRDTPAVDLSGLVPLTRKISTIGDLLGGGTLESDLTFRIGESPNRRAAIVTHSIAQSTTSGAFTTLAFDTDVRNSGGMHDVLVSNSRLKVKDSGLYLFGGHTIWENNAVGRRQTFIAKNGDTNTRLATLEQAIVASATVQFVIGFDLAQGEDFYELMVFQNSGGPLSLLSTAGAPSPRFWAVFLGK